MTHLKLPLKSGEEQDVFHHKDKLCWHTGQKKAIKRRYNKRVRRVLKREMGISSERLSNSLIDRDLIDIDRDLLSPEWFAKLYPIEDLSNPLIIKEPSRARKIYNTLRRFLS